MALRIGELARRTGVTPATLRFYETAALLTPTCRTASGYRVYEGGALGRIEFIRHAKQLDPLDRRDQGLAVHCER